MIELSSGEPRLSVHGGRSIRRTVSGPVRYTIRAGDSLSLIAYQYRVRGRQILRWNRINQQKVLLPGTVLLIYPHRSSA